MLDAARDGDARKAAAMLALAAGMSLQAVRRAATLRSAKALVSLVWKAGYSMKAGYAMTKSCWPAFPPAPSSNPDPATAFPCPWRK